MNSFFEAVYVCIYSHQVGNHCCFSYNNHGIENNILYVKLITNKYELCKYKNAHRKDKNILHLYVGIYNPLKINCFLLINFINSL